MFMMTELKAPVNSAQFKLWITLVTNLNAGAEDCRSLDGRETSLQVTARQWPLQESYGKKCQASIGHVPRHLKKGIPDGVLLA